VNDTSVTDLVTDWLSQREVADLLGVSPNKVRQLAREHQLVALRHANAREPEVPAEMLLDGALVKGLPGTLTVLADAGFDEEESVRWLFTDDESLPGRPIDALREHRGTEVRRRAQALAI
jgi:transcriptional regulator with XRE-family HTH domain